MKRSKFSRRMDRQERICEFKYVVFTSFGKYIESDVHGNSYATVVTEVWQLFAMRRRFIFIDGDLCHIEKE